ncbi:hypothetical protein BDE36_3315 [Arcticibacter tournemirensis]|nr:hypothetical protein BDE36_3315 [Arcticibacter tournemirensis]
MGFNRDRKSYRKIIIRIRSILPLAPVLLLFFIEEAQKEDKAWSLSECFPF